MKTSEIILSQLGGNKFVAMTGAKQLVGGESMLQFGIGRGAVNKANKVRIDLVGDLYEVRFFNIRGVNIKEISVHTMIYGDRLAALFAPQTGMETRL